MSRRKAFVRKKYFTVDDANRTLPLVRAIVADVAQLANELQQRHDTWQRIRPGKQSGIGAAHAEELEQIQGELGRGAARLEELMDELRELGVEIKGLDGLVDFPCMMDGREVYLCWRLGETEVGHWHEIDTGFAGRQKLRRELTPSEAAVVTAE